MSVASAGEDRRLEPGGRAAGPASPLARIGPRGIQVSLGFLWLLDGTLQFQRFMYSPAFVRTVLEPEVVEQPSPLRAAMHALAHLYVVDATLWNTLAAELQCAIGVGLILGARTVRAALIVSFAWALAVWWVGEGLGRILTGSPESPVMGGPGAALLYALVGVLAWPRSTAAGVRAEHRGRFATMLRRVRPRLGEAIWSAIWMDAAVLLAIERPGYLRAQISGMAEASPRWLGHLQSLAASAVGQGGASAMAALALVCFAAGLGVWTRRRSWALWLGCFVAALCWVVGQSLGGPFWSGRATDVNTGPLLVLLAVAIGAGTRHADCG